MAFHYRVMDCFAALAMTLAFLFAAPAAAQSFPPLTGPVVDQADLLRPEQELDLKSKLAALETQSGRQMVVATVNSLEGKEIADYSYQLGRHWKIGDQQRDDGVILVVAPKERKVWIATGYGADDVLTDAMTGVIIRQEILPRFKAGDMGGGIVAGTDAVIRQLQLPANEAARRAREAGAEQRDATTSGGGFIPVIVIMIVFYMIIRAISRRAGGKRYHARRHRRGIDPWIMLWGLNEISRASRGGGGGWGGGGWGGGGFGGGGFGGFSGGGGSFGGGGAGGSW